MGHGLIAQSASPQSKVFWGELRQHENHVCSEENPLFHLQMLQTGVFLQKENRIFQKGNRHSSLLEKPLK